MALSVQARRIQPRRSNRPPMTAPERDPRSQALKLDGVPVATLARKFGTPLYVYSHSTLVANYDRIRQAFAEIDPLIAFSTKSNTNGTILRILLERGAGLDIVSGGELERALRAGADPARIIYAGVGKTREEIAAALNVRILAFNVESPAEAEAINEVASGFGRKAPVAVRVNPDVAADTHHYISTGRKETKFGIPYHDVRRLCRRLARMPHLRLIGVHAHIGSQITQTEPFVKALERVVQLTHQLRRDGLSIDLVNLGGGFGIGYEESTQPIDLEELARRMMPMLRELRAQVIFEPGRSIVGPAGFLLTRVLYIKEAQTKCFAIVDGAMNDLLRPSLYSAYHRILLDGRPGRGRRRVYDVVGPICETGDFLGKDRPFPPLKPDDLLLVCDAGAYGMTMASNYNSRPRPAEVLVRQDKAYLIRHRETIDQIIGCEEIPPFLNGSGAEQRSARSPRKVRA